MSEKTKDRLFMAGVICAGCGLVSSRAAAVDGKEPAWAVPILIALLMGWVIFTVTSMVAK